MASALLSPPAAAISDLPIELHEQIISYLPWRDRINCEHVCKVWREVIRSRFSEGRYTIAPWLPEQHYDFGFYAPLKIHNLLLEGNTFSFKCHKGHKFFQVPGLVSDQLFQELEGSIAEDYLGVVNSICSFDIIEKNNDTENTTMTTKPVANLSLLNDMVVYPAWVYDDEIVKLYCSFTRQIPESEDPNANVADDNDENRENIPPENSDDETAVPATGNDTGTATQALSVVTPTSRRPTRVNVSDGSFTAQVHRDSDDEYFRLTLGGLLLSIRQNLLDDVFKEAGLDEAPSSSSSDSQDKLMRDKRRRKVEDATIVIDDLHFVKVRENQALSIVFNALVLPDKGEPINITDILC
ncbi:hypothetical protein H072_1813 [Dactylellina haptotyla CBS 200.50]|uniref:F-box domain-containing protein n=1 Tax=Dactylellina haptotyla (strain CBS 200.50) TaxID=1284197 RepID=S8AMP4_DACHA|nr:hypothetical protein H072_1813 [Dactylellina haptotyla CBS 200.50]